MCVYIFTLNPSINIEASLTLKWDPATFHLNSNHFMQDKNVRHGATSEDALVSLLVLI